ncbi:PepSY domain-containing protein [Herminiimonas contaminans]|uniref:PepSY domain-containing protein n=1 Tax=Herminiimonas contaminans TaxID=1111140 RepID=A0ABS0EVV4_9BURK|nr:PepSY-associated TM helix domain-containing protein [Herminiimonas contaminans]MBF8177977.1 PepSY domain-containing protein [Herminiimonas contaminans]
MLRGLFVLLHRWCGLTIALFLLISGLTGAVISWDHELDEWLNDSLFKVDSRGPYKQSMDLVKVVEQADPRATVTFMPLQFEEGHSALFGVSAKVNPASGRLYELGYNQVFVDPVAGRIVGQREWGAVSLSRENLLPFLYKLHYSLHIPEMWGIDEWGVWFMGIIAIIWVVDCFFGFYLTLPVRREKKLAAVQAGGNDNRKTWWQRWQPSWRVRWSGGSYKLNFDLHRAFSLWTWGLLFILAFTAFSLNLYREVFYPVMSLVSKVTPGPFDVRTPVNPKHPILPVLSFPDAIQKATAEANQRGWKEPIGSVFYSNTFGIYGASFFHPGDDHGGGGVGPAALYFDGKNGSYLGNRLPWQGTAADIFLQMQFPLHSGRILGLPGRILISLMGLLVSMLSITGVVIWWKKRKARVRSEIQVRNAVIAKGDLPQATA